MHLSACLMLYFDTDKLFTCSSPQGSVLTVSLGQRQRSENF